MSEHSQGDILVSMRIEKNLNKQPDTTTTTTTTTTENKLVPTDSFSEEALASGWLRNLKGTKSDGEDKSQPSSPKKSSKY